MTLHQQLAAVGGVLVVLAVVLGLTLFGMHDAVFPVDIGAHAPPFNARLLPSGTPRTLASYKGRVVLLNVWATWCPPCRAEMPAIEKLYQAYGPQGLAVVAVSVDTGISDSAVVKFTRDLGLTFDILRDSSHAIETAYQITGYPETFVIDDMGVIRKKWISAYDWSSPESQSLISHLMGIAGPRSAAR